MSTTYKDSGVDIDAGNEVVERIREAAASTFTPAVLCGIGSFGSFYSLADVLSLYRDPVLVQSVDGVGTKTLIAKEMNDFSKIGADLVSACCNDIAVHGAVPLTFLDYIANDALVPEEVVQIVQGIAEACRSIGVSLVGGETAEMPGVYLPGSHDLVGVVTGVVEKHRIINGASIAPGDVVIGVGSSGLHTNGYSLARKVLSSRSISLTHELPLGVSIGEALLRPHVNYTTGIRAILNAGVPVKGMAHITGGGLIENIPRILPAGTDAVVHPDHWETPDIFTFLRKHGEIPVTEMYRVFNMGIGLAVVVPEASASDALSEMTRHFPAPCMYIGEVTPGSRKMRISDITGGGAS